MWIDLAPPQRVGHMAVFDSRRDRMLVYGGHQLFSSYGSPGSTDLWSYSPTESPAWARLVTTGNPPPGQIAFYDSLRDRMIVEDGSGLTVAELRLADLHWTTFAPAGTWPGMFTRSITFDPGRNRMLVFGGLGVEGTPRHPIYHNDVWALDFSPSPQWIHLTPAGTPPSPRSGPPAIFDGARDRMLFTGGSDTLLWSLDFSGDSATWRVITAAGTGPPSVGDVLYDPAGSRMFVLQSNAMNEIGGDVWTLSLGDAPAWTHLLASGNAPVPRYAPSVVLDPGRGRLVLHGGGEGLTGGETWIFEPDPSPRWMQVGVVPPGRFAQTAVLDESADRLIVFGGAWLNDTWAKDLPNGPWMQWAATGATPPPRWGHVAILDPLRRRMIAFGGFDGPADADLNDTWALSLDGTPAWSEMHPLGAPPAARVYASAIYDPVRDRMLLIGGSSLVDVWSLSLDATPTWTQLFPAGGLPAGRNGASTVYDSRRDRVLLYGGSSIVADDTVWALSLAPDLRWDPVPVTGSPGLRAYHGADYDPARDRMLIFGGLEDVSDGNDAWELSLGDTSRWTRLSPAGVPPYKRSFVSAVFDPTLNAMLVFGGLTTGMGEDTIDYNDLWALTWPDVPTAVLVSVAGATATAGSVELRWYVSGVPDITVTVQRSSGPAWECIGRTRPDGRGQVRFVDAPVSPGHRYGYRLGIVERGVEHPFGETWITIPRELTFGLDGVSPNPAASAPTLRFSLASDRPATLEILDVAGRRIFTREVGSLGTGAHAVSPDRQLMPGVYLVRLRQDRQVATTRMCVVN